MGSRPSIIDGLPVIGRALLHENLWFNFGHHHIGLSLSAGSALLLTALLQDSQPPVDLAPFDPGRFAADARRSGQRSEEHTSELQSLMRISYAVFCLKKKNISTYQDTY